MPSSSRRCASSALETACSSCSASTPLPGVTLTAWRGRVTCRLSCMHSCQLLTRACNRWLGSALTVCTVCSSGSASTPSLGMILTAWRERVTCLLSCMHSCQLLTRACNRWLGAARTVWLATSPMLAELLLAARVPMLNLAASQLGLIGFAVGSSTACDRVALLVSI